MQKPGYIKITGFIYNQRDRRECCDFSTNVLFYSSLIPFHYIHTLLSISENFKIKGNKVLSFVWFFFSLFYCFLNMKVLYS